MAKRDTVPWTGFRGDGDKMILFCRECKAEQRINLPVFLTDLPKIVKEFSRDHVACNPAKPIEPR